MSSADSEDSCRRGGRCVPPPESLELIANRFAALAEPMRLRLVHALFSGEQTVGDLVSLTGGTQTNVSRHLNFLAKVAILKRRKQGLQVFYAIADPSIFQLCEIVCGSLEQQTRRQAEALSESHFG